MDNYNAILNRKAACEAEFIRYHIRKEIPWARRLLVKLTWWLYARYGKDIRWYKRDDLIVTLEIGSQKWVMDSQEEDAALERLLRKRGAKRRWRSFVRPNEIPKRDELDI